MEALQLPDALQHLHDLVAARASRRGRPQQEPEVPAPESREHAAQRLLHVRDAAGDFAGARLDRRRLGRLQGAPPPQPRPSAEGIAEGVAQAARDRAARWRYSSGQTPYAARNARLKWAALVSPQRAAIALTGSAPSAGSSRSWRQRSSRRRRIQPATVVSCATKSLCR